MNCTGTDPTYVHIGTVIPVDGSTPDNAPFVYSKYNCDLPVASFSGTSGTVEIGTASGTAIADGIYILWFQLVVLIVLAGITLGTYLFKK
jgi:hypothetical protein